MVTTQSADSVLKSYYLDVVSEQLDKTANPFLAQIKKTTSDVWGRDVRKTVRYGVTGGIGAGTEAGDLPKSNDGQYAQLVATLKNLYGTIEISDKAIRASGSNEGAFVNLLNDEMDGLVKSSSFNLGRMLFGDGSGKLAAITSVDAGIAVDAVNNLAEGMIVDLFAKGTSSPKAKGLTITSVDRKNKKIALSGGEPAADDFLTLQNSYGLELTGLGAICSETGTLYGLDKADHSWLVPYVREEVGELSENVLQTAIDAVEESSGSKTDFIVCSWGVRRALVEALSAYRKTDPVNLAGGYVAISFNGIPVVADRFCPAGMMYLLDTADFAMHQLCDWQWMEGEDGKILKQIPGKAAYTATLVKYAELLCYRPCGQGVLKGIVEK